MKFKVSLKDYKCGGEYNIFKPYFDIQKRRLKKLIAELLVDDRHILIVGQTASGKTTFCKALLGICSRFIVLDFNNEYEYYSPVQMEFKLRKECFSYYLRLLEPSIPQEMLSILLKYEKDYDEALLQASVFYDIKVVNALRLRRNSFNKIRENFRYTIPVVKLTHIDVDVRVPFVACVLADRLLGKESEVLVVEEAQIFKDSLNFLAEEGRKRGKKLIFITNNPENIPSGVLHNSNILIFRSLPTVKYRIGIIERWFKPERLKQGEFYCIIPGEKIRKFKVKLW